MGEGSDSQFQTVLAHSPGFRGAPCAPGTVTFFPNVAAILFLRSHAGAARLVGRLFTEVTFDPPAMGAHFAALSLTKWPPSRAALMGLNGG